MPGRRHHRSTPVPLQRGSSTVLEKIQVEAAAPPHAPMLKCHGDEPQHTVTYTTEKVNEKNTTLLGASRLPSEKLSVIALYKYTTWGTGFHSKASRFASILLQEKVHRRAQTFPSVNPRNCDCRGPVTYGNSASKPSHLEMTPRVARSGLPPKNLKGVSSFRGPSTKTH